MKRWGNVECRVYRFVSKDDEDAVLVPVEEQGLGEQSGKPVDGHGE